AVYDIRFDEPGRAWCEELVRLWQWVQRTATEARDIDLDYWGDGTVVGSKIGRALLLSRRDAIRYCVCKVIRDVERAVLDSDIVACIEQNAKKVIRQSPTHERPLRYEDYLMLYINEGCTPPMLAVVVDMWDNVRQAFWGDSRSVCDEWAPPKRYCILSEEANKKASTRIAKRARAAEAQLSIHRGEYAARVRHELEERISAVVRQCCDAVEKRLTETHTEKINEEKRNELVEF
ncbi:MAG: hypothetical protein WAN46_21620, partial [Gammaproteobacteria bacterium]